MELKAFCKPKKFAFKSVAVIDADLHFQHTTRSYCSDLGLQEVYLFDSCADAWTHIKEGRFDLIVLDWRCKGELNPIGLFNRIKNSTSTLFTPILITSGYTERHDFRLLQEFPLVSLVEKPFTAGIFYQTIEALQTERAWYLKNTKKLSEMIDTLSSKKKIRKHIDFVVNKAPNPAPLAAVLGRVLRQKQLYQEAEDILRSALANNSQHVALLNEIGKLFHVLSRHKQALRYLKRAGALSPENTQRLCLIGELELGESHPKAAEASFQSALNIDPWYLRAKEGLGLSHTVDKFFQEYPDDASTNRNFASLMNTIGISNVRSGKLDEGIKHYNSALKFIEDPITKSKIMFNIGLGFLRFNNIKNALLWFMRSSKAGKGVYPKADSYITKLSDMFVLTSDTDPSPMDLSPDEGSIITGEVDDLDDLTYDDFDDDIIEYSDIDEFEDESLLGS